MKWYKTSNNLIDDSKLKLVSYKSNVPHYVTIVTFHSLLERCSKNNSNCFGDLSTIVDEIALQCSLDALNVSRCINGLTLHGLIQDNLLTQWDSHQANTSTIRVKEWRKKRNETLQSVAATDVTQIRGEENREEENRIESKGTRLEDFCKLSLEGEDLVNFISNPENTIPDVFGDIWKERRGDVDNIWGEWTKFYKYFTSPDAKRPVKKDWATTWINWITKG